MNSLPKTVTRQRRGCNLNTGPSVPESSTLTTRQLSHPSLQVLLIINSFIECMTVQNTNMLYTNQQSVAASDNAEAQPALSLVNLDGGLTAGHYGTGGEVLHDGGGGK